ncbi:TetR family transcriptional regulator [Hoyosella altamirensis]|uniref:AcrR family transcriptional regulator n=1 Tax=Hoyosella altamirensis TaxID=616997 RepID=A0A839RL16_9ACTN|nr:TetR family transcriptional regulator [Hoyosella altamirensis]MBB3037160.1 AcrR family transcriptional regulator [Hoyosella altamirensis]
MARPRIHDLDHVYDATERLLVHAGPAAVTVRAVAAATGMPNGALYHAFGSRAGLLGGTWLRAAQRFLTLQTTLIDNALGSTTDGIEAVVAAADAPAVFANRFPASAKMLHTVNRNELLGQDLPPDTATDLGKLEQFLTDLLVRLALRLWDRKDRWAVDVITTCVVDLPTSILLSRDRLKSSIAREHLRAAVRAVLEVGPPPLTAPIKE